MRSQSSRNDQTLRLKHSSLGKAAFLFFISSFLFIALTGILAPTNLWDKYSFLRPLLFSFILVFSAVSTVLSIMDIRKKDRKKLLSFISLFACGGIVGSVAIILLALIALSKLTNPS